MLQPCSRGPRHRGSDGVTVLARRVGQSARHGALHALSAGRAIEQRREGRQVGRQLQQRVRTGIRDNVSFHNGRYSRSFHNGKDSTKLMK